MTKTVRPFAVIGMALSAAAFALWLSGQMTNTAIDNIPVLAPAHAAKSNDLSEQEIKQLCSLDVVTGPGCAKYEPKAKPVSTSSKTIIGHVTTYQAVKGQTDSTPCIGAMAGVNFCHPPYPLVANNRLALGSKVSIRGITYVVADRMNQRFDGTHFDILTQGENYTLRNEPITIL